MKRETAQAITEAVDSAFNRQLEFTAELSRCPSVRGSKAPIQDHMQRKFSERRFDIDR